MKYKLFRKLQTSTFFFLSLVLNFSSYGQVQQWQQTIFSEVFYNFNEVIETTDKGYFLVGSDENGPLMIRFASTGQQLWELRDINTSGINFYSATAALALKEGKVLVLGTTLRTIDANNRVEIFFLTLDAAGNQLDLQFYGVSGFNHYAHGIAPGIEDGYVVSARSDDLQHEDHKIMLLEFNETFEQRKVTVIPDRHFFSNSSPIVPNNLSITQDSFYSFSVKSGLIPNPSNRIPSYVHQVKYDYSESRELTTDFDVDDFAIDLNNQVFLWDRFTSLYQIFSLNGEIQGSYNTASLNEIYQIIPIENNAYIIYGSQNIQPGDPCNNQSQLYIELYNQNHQLQWQRPLGTRVQVGCASRENNQGIATSDGGYLFFDKIDEDFVTLIYKTDKRGLIYNNFIQGRISYNPVEPCIETDDSKGLKNWLITASGENNTFYGISNAEGQYEINTSSDTYTITATPPAPIWEACQASQVVVFEDSNDTIQTNIQFNAPSDCPYLSVNIGTPFLRRCFENTYTVNYSNDGAVEVEDSEVTIIFDPFLEVISSTLPWSAVEGQQYTFSTGALAAGDSRSFNIVVLVNCEETDLGQVHCVEASITPDTLCHIAPLWSGATLAVTGSCEGDSILFVIENIGTGATETPLTYSLIQDTEIIQRSAISLAISEQHSIRVLAEMGSSYRLEIPQPTNHPYTNEASANVLGCIGEPLDMDFNTRYTVPDDLHTIDIDCQANIGAFDPNDKRVFPTGTTTDNFIKKNTPLEYHIRFQNTGTDTAFQVVIKDTLSHFLDLKTLRVVGTSHPFQLSVQENREISFLFKDILLVDSFTNEPASHGFIRFAIQQKKNLDIGTRIENSAGIFFDFNEPIITNTAFNTIGQLSVGVDDITTPTRPNIVTTISPNPFSKSTFFEFKNIPSIPFKMHLFNAKGQLVLSPFIKGSQLILSSENLEQGLYFYKIIGDAQIFGEGKIIVLK